MRVDHDIFLIDYRGLISLELVRGLRVVVILAVAFLIRGLAVSSEIP